MSINISRLWPNITCIITPITYGKHTLYTDINHTAKLENSSHHAFNTSLSCLLTPHLTLSSLFPWKTSINTFWIFMPIFYNLLFSPCTEIMHLWSLSLQWANVIPTSADDILIMGNLQFCSINVFLEVICNIVNSSHHYYWKLMKYQEKFLQ